MRAILFSLACGVAACAADVPTDEGSYVADPSDFASKADGISHASAATLAFLDGAKTRIYAQVPTFTDTTLLSHLRASAARGVDVHVYVAVPHPAHPTTVLAIEQQEAAGVDVTVVRTTALPGFYAIADDKMLVSGGGTKTGTAVDDAARKFEDAIAEDTTTAPPALGSDGTALFFEPDAGAGPIVSLIGSAQRSIDLEIYQLQSPAAIAALVDAQSRGVTVRVMLEPKTVGSQNYKMAAAQLMAAGISVKSTPPTFDSSHNVDHAKFMILDGQELVFGSGNMVRSGLGGSPAKECTNRDFWVRDQRSAVVREAQSVFDHDWARTSTSSSSFDHLVLTPDNADSSILDLIDRAQSRLYLYNQSLNDSGVLSHLASAKQRGVDVHVLLGMQPGFGGAPPANQAAIDELTGEGIPAAFFTAHYLHGKVIVIDDAAFVGSQNFTSGGLKNNRELGEILDSSTIVSALAKQFEADQAHPAP